MSLTSAAAKPMNNPIVQTICYCLLCLSPLISRTNSLPPAPHIILGDSEYIVWPAAQVWVDSSGRHSDPTTIADRPFEQYENFNFSKTRYAYWLHFSCRNLQEDTAYYWLATGVFDSLSLITVSDGQLKVQNRGLLIDYEHETLRNFRDLQDSKYGFRLSLPPQTSVDYFLRIKNNIRFETSPGRIYLLKQTAAEQLMIRQAIRFTLFNALFYGLILFLMLFSLFQFMQVRDRSYLFYATYLAACMTYFWWKFEKATSFLNIGFSVFPEYYYYLEVPLTIAIYMSYFLFVAHLLNAKDKLPIFYKLLRIIGPFLLAYFGLAWIGAGVFGLPFAWGMIYWVRYLLIPLGLGAIYLVFKSKHRLGFYILSGTLFMVTGGAVTTLLTKLMEHHYEGPWDIPLIPVQIGILIETFFFSVGLGYKTRLAGQENLRMQITLEQQRKETAYLKQRKEHLTRLYAKISHESRTPLTVILGATRQIKGHRRERELIRRNGRQLLDLLNQVLDLNKLESEKMQLHWEQGDIIQFIRYSLEPFTLLAERKKQSFDLLCTPESLLMDFDRDKLQKIVSNLVSNAIKFTPPAGRIRVDAYQDIQQNEAVLLLEVSDSGPGIPPEFQEQIFDPYTQLPETEGGSGLGLAIAKEFALLMGGKIHLSSDSGMGSTFTLILPIRNSAEQISKPFPVSMTSLPEQNKLLTEDLEWQSGRASLLIVEDHQDIRMYLTQLLQTEYNVFMAGTGAEGLERAKAIRPDLIISDIMMPDMDGYVLCTALKACQVTKAIPLILVTARTSREDRLEGLRRKADVYLTKPFDPEELLIQVKRLIQRRQQEAGRTVVPHSAEDQENEAVYFLEQLHEVINQHLADEQFKTAQLGAQLGMNHVTLNKKIKALTGQTTGQYLRNYRLATAEELLRTTSLTVAEISYKIGVSEPSNFNNMFKKVYGKSPKQWREE